MDPFDFLRAVYRELLEQASDDDVAVDVEDIGEGWDTIHLDLIHGGKTFTVRLDAVEGEISFVGLPHQEGAPEPLVKVTDGGVEWIPDAHVVGSDRHHVENSAEVARRILSRVVESPAG